MYFCPRFCKHFQKQWILWYFWTYVYAKLFLNVFSTHRQISSNKMCDESISEFWTKWTMVLKMVYNRLSFWLFFLSKRQRNALLNSGIMCLAIVHIWGIFYIYKCTMRNWLEKVHIQGDFLEPKADISCSTTLHFSKITVCF
jgi:hypothetical protein